MQGMRELARKSDTDFVAWKDKLIRDGVTGIQERDRSVNDYADAGKRRPKNPDTIGPPCFLHEGMWGVSAPALYDESLGVMSLLPHADPSSLSTLPPPETTHY